MQMNLTPNSMLALVVIAIAAIFGFVSALTGFVLLSADATTTTTSSISGLEIYTANGRDELTMLRGCSDGQIEKFTAADGTWGCADDSTTSVTGAGADVFDIDDDDVNESTDFNELATTGDTNNVITEPSADKVLIDFTKNWPTADNATAAVSSSNADTATALAANGGNCAAGSAPLGVDASGAVESCTDYEEDLSNSAGLAAAISDETGTGNVVFSDDSTLGGTVAVTGSGSAFRLNLFCGTGAFANGGAVTTDANGELVCSDDDDSGGSSSNSFETQSTPAGDSPVADSATDTLTWQSSLGTVDITGSAAADSIDLDVATDGVGTDQLNDSTDTPTAGECVQVATDPAAFTYGACGGGSSNLWDTIDAPLGTDPVADSSNDTLLFQSSNSTVAITGSAPADSLDFDVLDSPSIAGTTVTSTAQDDMLLLGSGVGSGVWVGLPDCDTNNRDRIQYDVATNAFSCDTDELADADVSNTLTVAEAGSVDPDALTCDGTSDDLVADACLETAHTTDTGPSPDCAGTTTYQDGEGGCDTLDGLEDFETATDDSLVVGNGSSFDTKALPASCSDGNDALAYATGTNAFSCNSFTFSSPNGTVDITGSGTASLTFDVNSLDISDQTNLTCGRSLSVQGDGCEADPELYAIKKSIVILNPTTSETNLAQYEYPTASTITEVSCSTNTGTVTIQLDERARATPNSAGTDVMSATLTCDTNSQTTTSFSNAGIAADVPVNLQITATASTPGVVRIHIKANKDD